MASTDSPVRVIEVCKISPQPESATESSLPLTFFDAYVFGFHQVEYIFSYELTTDSASFFSSVVPKLKRSLSLTLSHFHPFAGKLVWPSHSDMPLILYIPGDGVSLIVAESDADFDHLSGNTIREVPDSRCYVPELVVSETEATLMSFQVTFFPHKGFCLGATFHHSALDGKSMTLFLKAWAHICKHLEKVNGYPTLPLELKPFLDRTVIKEPQRGLDMVFFNNWRTIISPSSGAHNNSRSLIDLFPTNESLLKDTNLVRATFSLSREDIEKIRQQALLHQMDKRIGKEDRDQTNSNHFSKFMLTYAYVAITSIKVRGLEGNKTMTFGLPCDVRARLDPPIPVNYFGNCLTGAYTKMTVKDVIKEEGLFHVVEELTKFVKGFEKGALDRVEEKFEECFMDGTPMIAVASSPRFEVYSIDFGWGNPMNVEVTSIDKDMSMSVTETKDGKGGIEVGIVLKKNEMETFRSLLWGGLS